jgi:hypothetical protein
MILRRKIRLTVQNQRAKRKRKNNSLSNPACPRERTG